MSSLAKTAQQSISVRPAELPRVPRRQAAWVTVQALVGLAAGVLGWWNQAPELVVAVGLGAGVAVIEPAKRWTVPLATAAVTAAGMVAQLVDLPAVLGAGLMAGVVAAWLVPHRTDWLDYVHGALATMTGSSVGLWAAVSLVPDSLPEVVTAVATTAIVALVAAQGLLPLAIRSDLRPKVPTQREIDAALTARYRPPVYRAVELYESARQDAPDLSTQDGMAEVATWVFRLQTTRQTLDQELDRIDVLDITNRIRDYEALGEDADDFTRERRHATADHLRRLLQHRSAMATEAERTLALVDYALAYLEEARAGLTLGRELPGEALPNRLPEVLGRLRTHAQEGDARRRTARELNQLQA